MDANNHPNDQNKERKQAPQSPKSEGAAGGSKRIFSKRWVYPAIYLGAAAVIIGLMYVKSQVGTSPVATPTTANVEGNGTEPTAVAETFKWPVAAGVTPKVSLGFFDAKGSEKQQAAALVVYDNGYYAHKGYDIQASNKKAFPVVAAVSGKVTAVVTKNTDLQGQIVEVQSANGYTEEYESLSATKVNVGDMVKQGQELGTSGTCEFEKGQGNHLYFQVSKGGALVNPATVLPAQQAK